MLERNPNLTGSEVRDILRDTAAEDAWTGPVPNPEWGFGKLDVLAALSAVPTPCAADLDGDGTVGITDFLELLAQWGTTPGGPPNFDGDGTVGITDFLELLAQWGPCT